jgi:hypothetical protein
MSQPAKNSSICVTEEVRDLCREASARAKKPMKEFAGAALTKAAQRVLSKPRDQAGSGSVSRL